MPPIVLIGDDIPYPFDTITLVHAWMNHPLVPVIVSLKDKAITRCCLIIELVARLWHSGAYIIRQNQLSSPPSRGTIPLCDRGTPSVPQSRDDHPAFRPGFLFGTQRSTLHSEG